MKLVMVPPSAMYWSMGTEESYPYYKLGAGQYPRSVKVDPYPGYHHNEKLVQDILDLCVSKFPLDGSEAALYVISHEGMGRSNGCTYEDTIWRRPDGTDWKEEVECRCGCGKKLHLDGQAHSILLFGKRICIMPEMTRYLVSHEYGHAVFHHITRLYGYPNHSKALPKKYMEIRGVTDYAEEYAGNQWHRAPEEIIANDFRILFTNQTPEFWPHDCEYPKWNSPIGTWWMTAYQAITGKRGENRL